MSSMLSAYPETPLERNQWVLSRRPARSRPDLFRPYDVKWEQEPGASGRLVPTLTVFLTNRECPWRCVMCDLWKNTLAEDTPRGAIPKQIEFALTRDDEAISDAVVGSQIKLYNSGSFFDRRAIPLEDHSTIARQLDRFERVIVECHPSLVNDAVLRFRDLLQGRLEVAMGLETAQPEVLERLNKRMTLEDFTRAADFLVRHQIDLRAFALVKPPFTKDAEALPWAKRTIEFAFDASASVVSLIPTRAGNGAMEDLARLGHFSPPSLKLLEESARYGVSLGRGRVFADLWDLEPFSRCSSCFASRRAALEAMNLTQQLVSAPECLVCGNQESQGEA